MAMVLQARHNFIPSRVLLRLPPNSARAVLHTVSQEIASDLARPLAGVQDMLSRHQGAAITPLEHGVVIIDQMVLGIDTPYLLIAQLSHPVDFQEGPDHHMTDLVIVYLSPDTGKMAHIRSVGRLVRYFHNIDLCEMIRGAGSPDAVVAIMTDDMVMDERRTAA